MGLDYSRFLRESVRIVPEHNEEEKKANLVLLPHIGDTHYSDWSEMHTCGLSEWTSGHSMLFGFDHKIDYCIPHMKASSELFLQNIQPYCTRGYQFKIEKLQKHEDITKRRNSHSNSGCKLPKIVSKRSRYVYPLFAPTVSIIGYQRQVAILQVIYKKTKELHFIAIELSTGKHLSVYKDIYISEPCIYEAYLSPDENYYLLRPNFYFAYSRCADPFSNFAITKDIKVLSIKQYDSHVINIIEDISSLWYSIAFNPQWGSSRIAVGNYTSDPMGDNIALFDLTRMEPMVCTEEAICSMSHHLVYNPQGTLLVSLGIRMMSPRVDLMYPVKVLFFHPENLTLLHSICRNSVSVNHFHASLTPLFSRTGEHMALIGNFGQTITVYKMPFENSLRSLCRRKILQQVTDELVHELPLPKKLQRYLMFQPEWC